MQGSNLRPKDYAYHFGFRRPFPVCGLDSILPFGLPVESLHVLRFWSFARGWHGTAAEAFTDVEKFYIRAEQTYPVQPNFENFMCKLFKGLHLEVFA